MANFTFPKIGNVDMRDLGKGFIVTIISTALTILYQSITENAIPTVVQIKAALLVGFGTGISYLIKQLITGIPPAIEIDPAKTIVVDVKTKEVLVNDVNAPLTKTTVPPGSGIVDVRDKRNFKP